jgi:hypothetical protein
VRSGVWHRCYANVFQVVAEFPVLDDYDDLWPLDLMLIAQLKYSSAASKGCSSKRTIDAVAATLASTTGTPHTRRQAREP